MNSTEWLPQYDFGYPMANWIFQYCGYARANISVNRVLVIISPVCQDGKKLIGHGYV